MTKNSKKAMLLIGIVALLAGCATPKIQKTENLVKKSKVQARYFQKKEMPKKDVQQLDQAYIPRVARSLQKRQKTKIALAWKGSKTGKGIMEWAYSERKGVFEEVKWIIPVRKGKKTIGFIGLDPKTKKIKWRAEQIFGRGRHLVTAVESFPRKKIVMMLDKMVHADKRSAYNIDKMTLATVHGLSYYMIPTAGKKPNEFLFVPLEDQTQLFTFEETLDRRGMKVGVGKKTPKSATFNLEPSEPISVTPGATTKMVGELPLLDQKSYPNCWAYAQAIIHQWWVPRNLGCSDYQTDLIRYYVDVKTSEGGTNAEVKKVMFNWDKVKQAWDNDGVNKIRSSHHATNATYDGPNGYWENKTWNDNFAYEDFKTTWWGVGKKIGTYDNTWKSNDLKAWLNLEAPVHVTINSSGNGDAIDHSIVVVGYDDALEEIYCVDPNGFQSVYDYTAFNNDYWNAHWDWEWDIFWWHYKRRGMIAAMPGDKIFVEMDSTQADIDSSITEGLTGSVRNIKMSITNDGDDAFSGTDVYGKRYKPEIKFQALSGQIMNPRGGQFNQMTTTLGDSDSSIVFRSTLPLPKGSEIGGASFDVKKHPNATSTSIGIKGTYTVCDKNNRSHFQTSETVEVFQDNPSYDGTTDMRKPLRYRSSREMNNSINVNDEDTTGPVIERKSSFRIRDNQNSDYNFIVEIMDASGIASTRCRTRYSSQANFGAWQNFTPIANWQYQITIPRSQWIQHIGEQLIVEVEATDNDNDNLYDQEKTVQLFEIKVEDDDDFAPRIDDYQVVVTPNQLIFRVKLRDDSGIAANQEYPELQYYVGKNSTGARQKTVLQPDSARGTNWFIGAVGYSLPAGYSPADLVNSVSISKKDPVYVYGKLKTKDTDNDRPDDAKIGLTNEWSTRIAGRQRQFIVDKYREWKYGIRKDPIRLYRGVLPEKTKVPEGLDDFEKRRIGIDYFLDGVQSGRDLTLVATVKEITGDNYYVRAKQVDAHGQITLIGTYKIDKNNKKVSIRIPKESTTSFGNSIVLESANIPAKKGNTIKWESLNLVESKRSMNRPDLVKEHIRGEKERGVVVKEKEKTRKLEKLKEMKKQRKIKK